MIELLNNIYMLSVILWIFLLPIGIYHGYIVGKEFLKKNQYTNPSSNLIIILTDCEQNYTIFIYCCIYSIIYCGLSLMGGIILYVCILLNDLL